MLSEFLLQFKNNISFFNLFEYLTFKTAISAITALIISFIIGPITIKKIFYKNKIISPSKIIKSTRDTLLND